MPTRESWSHQRATGPHVSFSIVVHQSGPLVTWLELRQWQYQNLWLQYSHLHHSDSNITNSFLSHRFLFLGQGNSLGKPIPFFLCLKLFTVFNLVKLCQIESIIPYMAKVHFCIYSTEGHPLTIAQDYMHISVLNLQPPAPCITQQPMGFWHDCLWFWPL